MTKKEKTFVERNRKAAWALAFLTPLIAELTFGSTPLHFAYLLLLWLPIYGAGVLLIRELVMRTGRGWPSIILLGLAYELAEDGLGLQALTSPHLYNAAEWAPQIFGFNVAYWLLNVIYHVAFSVVIPIFLTNLLFPAFKDKPYLKKGGLVWVGIFAVIGVAMLRGSVPPSQDPTYNEPLSIVLGCIGAIIVLGVIALKVMPRKTKLLATPVSIPTSKQLAAVGFFGTITTFALMYPFAGAHQPLFTHGAWAYVPIAAGTLLAFWIGKYIFTWSHSVQWNDGRAVALVGGALAGHTVFGLTGAHLQPIDRIGLVAMLIVTIWLLMRLYRTKTNLTHDRGTIS